MFRRYIQFQTVLVLIQINTPFSLKPISEYYRFILSNLTCVQKQVIVFQIDLLLFVNFLPLTFISLSM